MAGPGATGPRPTGGTDRDPVTCVSVRDHAQPQDPAGYGAPPRPTAEAPDPAILTMGIALLGGGRWQGLLALGQGLLPVGLAPSSPLRSCRGGRDDLRRSFR